MRKLAAVAVVVAGAFASVGPRPAEAGPDPGEVKFEDLHQDRYFYELARVLGEAVYPQIGGGSDVIASASREIKESVKTGVVTPEGAFFLVTQALIDDYVARRFQLVKHSPTWRDRLDELKATDPEAAAAAAEVGTGSPADALREALERGADRSLRDATKGMGSIAKSLSKAGLAMTYVLRAPRTPHPTYDQLGIIPVLPSLSAVVGTSDGRLSVITDDAGAGRGVREWKIRVYVNPLSPPVAVRVIDSSIDFTSDGPALFQFEGLPPANYFVSAEIPLAGTDVVVDSLSITVPDASGPDRPIQNTNPATYRVQLGNMLGSFTSDASAVGRDHGRKSKAIARSVVKGALTPEEAVERFGDAIVETHDRFEEARRTLVVDFLNLKDELAASDPEAAGREMAAGAGTSADVVFEREQSAEADYGRAVDKAASTVRRALKKSGHELAFDGLGPGESRHPILEDSSVGAPPRPLKAVIAADGQISVITSDPAAGQAVDESSIQIFDPESIDFDPVADRPLRSGVDFPDGGYKRFEFSGLPPGTYIVSAGVRVGSVVVPLDAATITVPIGVEPPTCTGAVSTATATLNGTPLPILPLDGFKITLDGTKLVYLYASWADRTNPTGPRINFTFNPDQPVDLAGPKGEEMVFKVPPPDGPVNFNIFDPKSLTFTYPTSGRYTLRKFHNLLFDDGCAAVVELAFVKGRLVVFDDAPILIHDLP